MNCKQGDLAIVVDGSPNAGMMVTCLESLPAGFRRDDLPPFITQHFEESLGPLWRVDRFLRWGATRIRIAPDRYLMPIRPDSSDLESVEDAGEELTASGAT
jgi:hypothetical protein